MNEFAIPLSIEIEKEDQLAEICPILIGMGYKWGTTTTSLTKAVEEFHTTKYKYLNTNMNSFDDVPGNTLGMYNKQRSIHLPYNRDLILALAAMRTEGPAKKGEIWVWNSSCGSRRSYQVLEERENGTTYNRTIGDEGNNFRHNLSTSPSCRRATKEEIIELFMKETPKKIVGYKLLKDLPDLEKGHIFSWHEDNETWSSSEDLDEAYSYTNEQITASPKWFEPVYEEEKKELTLQVPFKDGTLEVKIGKGYIQVLNSDIDPDTLREFQQQVSGIPMIGRWSVGINTFSIGCKHGIPFGEIDRVLNAYNDLNS